MKILDGGEQNATAEDEFEEEPEIESIEGYDELEEEDGIEDFSNFAIEDALVNDVEPDPVDHKRVKREPESANGKLEKDARWLNKAKVLVEVEHEEMLMKLRRQSLNALQHALWVHVAA